MNETLDVIYDRRAIRKYRQIVVSRILIDQLLDAGRMAPSGMNLQPWRFFVVTDEEMIHKLDEQICVVVEDIYKTPEMMAFLKTPNPIFHAAPVVIFISGPRMDEWAALDIGMCAQNIMLAAESLGLATCPVGLAKFVERTSLYRQLNIPSTDQVSIALMLGYADETPAMHERKKDNVIYLRAGVSTHV